MTFFLWNDMVLIALTSERLKYVIYIYIYFQLADDALFDFFL